MFKISKFLFSRSIFLKNQFFFTLKETKETYYEELKKSREEFENENESSIKAQEKISKLVSREIDTQIADIDYSNIEQKNINILPMNFNSKDELIYYLQSIRLRLTENNLLKCIDGLLIYELNDLEIENNWFKSFVNMLKDSIIIASNDDFLLKIAKFADLYCIQDNIFWESLERKVISRLNNIKTGILPHIMKSFARQKEGSEQLYDRAEDILTFEIENMDFHELLSVLEVYYFVKFGSKEFVYKLVSKMEEKINFTKNLDDIADFLLIYNQTGVMSKIEIIEKIEKIIFSQVLSFETSCKLGKAFGKEKGSKEIMNYLQKTLIELERDFTEKEIILILEGFIYHYRASDDLLKKTLKSIKIENLDVIQQCNLVKALNIMDFNDSKLNNILEKHIVNTLKDIKNIKINEITEILITYCITRNGSRELYRLLELVINYKLKSIAKDPKILNKIHICYMTSGFCNNDLLLKIESLLN